MQGLHSYFSCVDMFNMNVLHHNELCKQNTHLMTSYVNISNEREGGFDEREH